MFILEGGSISWCSKKEDCFSLSTMKSEYIACTAAVQEAIWLRNSLLCLDVTKHAYKTTVIYCDNTAAILFFSTNIHTMCREEKKNKGAQRKPQVYKLGKLHIY